MFISVNRKKKFYKVLLYFNETLQLKIIRAFVHRNPTLLR